MVVCWCRINLLILLTKRTMNITTQQLQQKYKTKKHNAKRLGHEFSLSFEQFKILFENDYCYYTKEKMTLGLKNNEQKPTDITIDRVNNHIGYVNGNVVTVYNLACAEDNIPSTLQINVGINIDITCD